MKQIYIISTLLLLSMAVTAQESKTSTFVNNLPTPLRWIAKNWSAKDSVYCINAEYNTGIELMDKMSQEYISFANSEGHRFKASSRLANRIGPYFGYSGLYAGSTFDIFAKSTSRRQEITFYVNSQLCCIEVIRRRTGGDFRMDEFTMHTDNNNDINMTDAMLTTDIGDFFKNDLTGVNINYFVNHRKYSNPAGFTRGTIQKRSAGTIVIGAGFTRQKMSFGFYDDSDIELLTSDAFGMPGPDYGTQLLKALSASTDPDDQEFFTLNLLRAPNEMIVDDARVQLGYAYNWVIAPRLLFAAQMTINPGIKHIKTKSRGTLAYDVMKKEGNLHALDTELAERLNQNNISYDPLNIAEGNYGPSIQRNSAFDINYACRMSLTYRWNRWRISSRFQYNAYNYNKGNTELRDHYWDLRFAIGYNFWKKQLFSKKNGNLK